MISTPPTKAPLVDGLRNIALTWLSWFNSVRDHATFTEVSATYDPPSLGAGAAATTTVTVRGYEPGDFASASFIYLVLDIPTNTYIPTMTAGVTVTAEVTLPDTVSVTFLNLSGGTVDMASGTVRVRVSRRLT